MAPEKIWVTTSELTVLLAEKRNSHDVAYIREDIVDEMLKTAEDHAYFAGQEKLRETLLEWAKEKREQMKIEAGGCSNMLASGKYLAFEEAIKKLESL